MTARPRKLMVRFILSVGLVAAAVVMMSAGFGGAWSQTARTIKVVVPFSAGGLVDFVARVLAEQVGRAQGQTVLIEWEAQLTMRPNGKRILLREIAIHEIRNGKIVRERFYYDPASFRS